MHTLFFQNIYVGETEDQTPSVLRENTSDSKRICKYKTDGPISKAFC
jgi:hypothetical protein